MNILNLPHEIVISEDRIRERVIELGVQITLDYKNRDLIVIGILKGSLLFFSDLIRNIQLPIFTDFLSVSSYNGRMQSSGDVKIINDISIPVKEKDILIIEDIIDTGATSKFLMEHLKKQNPSSVKICSLLDKKNSRIPGNEIKIDYTGFEVPDKFLVGYGLDYKEKYRNLPCIAAITKEVEE